MYSLDAASDYVFDNIMKRMFDNFFDSPRSAAASLGSGSRAKTIEKKVDKRTTL